MVIKLMYDKGDYYIEVEGVYHLIALTKEEFLDLYRQMTRLLVDEVVDNYDPDKHRPGFGGSESHKKIGNNITEMEY